MTVFDGSAGAGMKELLKWIENNPEGFFVDCKGEAEQMLHRAPCKHVKLTGLKTKDANADLAKNVKVCSNDRTELERWAREERPGRLSYCKYCKPMVDFEF